MLERRKDGWVILRSRSFFNFSIGMIEWNMTGAANKLFKSLKSGKCVMHRVINMVLIAFKLRKGVYEGAFLWFRRIS